MHKKKMRHTKIFFHLAYLWVIFVFFLFSPIKTHYFYNQEKDTLFSQNEKEEHLVGSPLSSKEIKIIKIKNTMKQYKTRTKSLGEKAKLHHL